MIRASVITFALLIVFTAVARADSVANCLTAHKRIRNSNGPEPLRPDKRLCAAAQWHA